MFQQARCLHDLPGLTVAALWNLFCNPGRLQCFASFGFKTLDCRDCLARDCAERRHASSNRVTRKMYRAGATHRDAAAEFGALLLQFIANHPQKWRIRRTVGRNSFAVQLEFDHDIITPLAISFCGILLKFSIAIKKNE